MAFTDPQTITISAVPIPLPRTSTSQSSSSYTSADGLVRLSMSHATSRRTRRVIRVDHSKITADPFIPTQNAKVSMSNYIVFDAPPAGYTNADLLAVWSGLNTLVTGTSNAAIVKLLGGES